VDGGAPPADATARDPADPFAAARSAVASYYTRKVRRHGATPAGVDWGSATAQELRFALLLGICDFAAPFSLNDVGCGYGALLTYLARRHAGAAIDYLGCDLSAAMIRRAAPLAKGSAQARFVQAGAAPRRADYAVASGVFNVVPDNAAGCWEAVVASTLAEIHASVRRGFAVNFLAPAPDRPGLYRTSPEPWAAYCRRSLGGSVEVRAGYGLNEFTLLVRPGVRPRR
jgi:SAM-dependent methyltransferase